jgi:hypothetical protein
MRKRFCWIVTLAGFAGAALAAELPGRYFQYMESGARQVDARLTAEPNADLESL